MSLCNRNYSVGIYDRPPDYIIKMTKHKVEGLIGVLLDRLLIKKERKCEFHSVYDFGELLDNGSYYGVLDLFKNDIIDVYQRPETMFLYNHESFLEISKLAYSEPFQVGQFLDEPISEQATSLDFLWQNMKIIYVILVGYFLAIFFIASFFAIDYKFNSIRFKKYLWFALIKNETKKRKGNLILIFLSFFLFISTTILTNLIKTEKVIVDTSNIIYNLPELYETKKIACWLKAEQDYLLVKKAPKNSFLAKIFSEKRFKKALTYPNGEKSPICLMNTSLDPEQIKLHIQFGLSTYFLLMSETTLLLLLSYFTNNAQNLIIFKNDVNYYELNLVHYLRSNLEYDKKVYLLSKLTEYFEKGFYINFFDQFHRGLFDFLQKQSTIYSNLEEYIDDYTRLENVKIDFFKNLLLSLFIVQLVTLLIFSLHVLIQKFSSILRKN